MYSFEFSRSELVALTAAAVGVAGLLFVGGHVVGSAIAAMETAPTDSPESPDLFEGSPSLANAKEPGMQPAAEILPRRAAAASTQRITQSPPSTLMPSRRSYSDQGKRLSFSSDRRRVTTPWQLSETTERRVSMLSFRSGHTIPTTPFGYLIYDEARRRRLNPALVAAVISVESGFDPQAVSARGAIGLMQVIPDTATRFGVDPEQLTDPFANVTAGTEYLRWLAERYDGDAGLALAAYNAGDGAVDRWGGVPPYRETREYVRRVFSALDTIERAGSG
jgi:soluble lytic murein transglycosylase-like protein